ncbi:MAG: acyl-CoA reductase [Rikenellaceae bacterium]
MVDIFVELGDRLSRGLPADLLRRAVAANGWFEGREVEFAVRAICEQMLRREALEEWIGSYGAIDRRWEERVLVVMAGNIPLVGFSDLLSVLMTGRVAILKLSHKDRPLMEWVVGELRTIEPDIPIYIYNDSDQPDRVIATGGDSAVRHYAELYGSLPMLLRGSRHSVAVIGEGSACEGLASDIYRYSGLGCRSVSMLFVPEGYDAEELVSWKETTNAKYRNNYLQSKALLRLQGVDFYDNGVSCFVRSESFSDRVSLVSIVEYSSIEEVEAWLRTHDDEIQCVVGDAEVIVHPRRVDFGSAQHPTLWDYADGVDTVAFLTTTNNE